MNPFIIVIYQGLSAAAEILLCLTVPLQFISVTAGFIFTKRHSCLHLILICGIFICGWTEEQPRALHILPSSSVTAQWATASPGTGFYHSTVQRDAQQGQQWPKAPTRAKAPQEAHIQWECMKGLSSQKPPKLLCHPVPLRGLKLRSFVCLCHPWGSAL